LNTAASPESGTGAVHQSVVFLARFFGLPISPEHLADSLSGGAADGLAQALELAGLVATPLPPNRARRATEFPALAVGADGQAVVVLSIRQDGRLECHLPGIEGVSWLSSDELAQAAPQTRWLAVRPALHLDQRSLLYALPQARKWFWDVFNRNRSVFRWALLGTLVLNLFAALVPFYTMAVYDRVVPNNAVSSLWTLTIAVVLVIGFEFLMRALRSELIESAARRMDVALSAQIYARCLRMRASSRPASGGVLANTVRDFETVREFFATGTLTILGDLPFLVLFLGVIALVGGWLVMVPIAFIPVMLLVALAAQRPLKAKVAAAMQESAQRTAHLFESMNGLDTIKALGAEAWSRRKWENLTLAISQNSLETREFISRINYVNAGLMSAAGVGVIAVGALMIGEQALSLGQLIAVSLLTGRALAPINQVASLMVRWQQTKLSFDALEKIMSAPTDESAGSLTAPRLSGRIRFQDVSFSYPKQPKVIEGMNLQIAAGERVGIIGKLGSGKSSMLRLLLNQYEPDSGSVQIDDLVTTQLEPLSLRRQMGYVPQDVTLFHGTIRENIELGRTQTDDAMLLDAIRLSCLDDIITQLPGGVGTEVGERGERLSGGQRQAVAIARALLSRPRILLLDEPSSMMDPATEQKLITRLRSLADTTIVLVTHRMAMLSLIDRLIVLDHGRIVADGPRDEVLRALTQSGTKVQSVRPVDAADSGKASA
jgi:ATP-binding cassette, subfamily C, bacterial LapB